MGRVVHPSFLEGGQPVSASATMAPGLAHTYDGKTPYIEARALRTDQLPDIVADFRRAARNAIAAGFDGIQLQPRTATCSTSFYATAATGAATPTAAAWKTASGCCAR
jgi:hypothetical protein